MSATTPGMIRLFVRHAEVGPFTSCWPYRGAHQPSGYGVVAGRVNGTPATQPAHRIAYELIKGRIPAGLEIDHLCRNRGCVNPAHLEAVTHLANIQRANAAKAAA